MISGYGRMIRPGLKLINELDNLGDDKKTGDSVQEEIRRDHNRIVLSQGNIP
jgi:hypothetical protein